MISHANRGPSEVILSLIVSIFVVGCPDVTTVGPKPVAVTFVMVSNSWNTESQIYHEPKCCSRFIDKYKRWQPPEDSVAFDYCRNSGLHGLKYIGQPDHHIVERIFWLIAFTCGVSLAMFLIRDVLHKYNMNPVIVSFQPYETQIESIPFPAVTICNMNKVLKSKAMTFIKEEESKNIQSTQAGVVKRQAHHSNYHYLEHVCYADKSFSKKFNATSQAANAADKISSATESGHDEHFLSDCPHCSSDAESDVKEFLRVASQPCDDMLKLCVWEEMPIECLKIFKPLETDYGKCCVFNLVPPTLLDTLQNNSRDDPAEVHEWAKWDPRKKGLFLDENFANEYPRRQWRAGKTYGLSVLLNPNLEEYFCSASDSKGFRMVANLPIEFPQVMDFGIALPPQSEVFVGLRPDIVMSEQAIFRSPLEKRECYFPGEFPLQYYNFYTAANCVNECIANETFTRCKCVTYFMPRDSAWSLCDVKDFPCVSRTKRNFTRNGKKANCGQCLPACTEIRYLMEVTETPLLSQAQGWIGERTDIASWAAKNASIVHVYFVQDATYARIRRELYGLTDLIASAGGLMGLCLGFSGLSLVEILYFITLWACRRNNSKRKTCECSSSSSLDKVRNKLAIFKNWGISRPSPATEKANAQSPAYMWELSPKFLPVLSLESEHHHNHKRHNRSEHISFITR